MKILKKLPLFLIAALAISCSNDDDNSNQQPTSQDSALEYKNGEFITGTTTSGGTAAAAGLSWSEMSTTDTFFGYGANKDLSQKLADDFTVPENEIWKIKGLDLFVYQTGFSGASGPVSSLAFEIYASNPAVPGAVKVFGDMTTNRVTSSTDTKVFRITNNIPNESRKIFKVTSNISELILKPGTYWIVWQSAAQNGQQHFYVQNKSRDSASDLGNNAIQFYEGAWKNVVDIDKSEDFPFVLNGTKTTLN